MYYFGRYEQLLYAVKYHTSNYSQILAFVNCEGPTVKTLIKPSGGLLNFGPSRARGGGGGGLIREGDLFKIL